jgi:hypothetical protein
MSGEAACLSGLDGTNFRVRKEYSKSRKRSEDPCLPLSACSPQLSPPQYQSP